VSRAEDLERARVLAERMLPDARVILDEEDAREAAEDVLTYWEGESARMGEDALCGLDRGDVLAAILLRIVDARRPDCIDGPDGCRGAVLARWPGYGQKSYPRCERHGADRLERERENRRRYMAPAPPSDWSPDDAGETWDAEGGLT